MPTTFFTPERLESFWGYVRWFMVYNMPIFMICMAAIIASMFLDVVIETITNAKKGHDKKDDDDFDEEFY